MSIGRWWIVGSVGCTTYVAPEAPEGGAARFSAVDGSPEAVGLLAFVNDPGTSLAVLDVDVALDARAAGAIVAHRDGPDGRPSTADDDRFDTIAELDAAYYVGDSALTAILDYATAHGWVATDPDDVLGTWDGVTFTLGQADAVLATVNDASYAALDVDAALDKRAVDAIVAARPIDTIAELAGLSYVGASALTKLIDYAAAQSVDVWSTADLQAAFAVSNVDILFPSESDFPLDPVWVAGGFPVDVTNVKDVLAPIYVQRPEQSSLADRAIEVRTVGEALGFLVTPADWWSDYEVDRAADWTAILDVIDHLDQPMVYRFGDSHGTWLGGAIDVYVIGGSAEGDLVGFHTISVET
ncbi:MAG: nuclease A inhibitor family protein [Myxococcota bacterium]